MKLSKKDIKTLVSCGRLSGMPKGTYVAGYVDYDEWYYPIRNLDALCHTGIECELVALGDTDFYLRFI